MGVVSLVFGIISIVLCWIPAINWIGIILGIIGIVLGAVAKKKGQGTGTAGMVLSIVGTVLSLIMYLACVACVAAASTL